MEKGVLTEEKRKNRTALIVLVIIILLQSLWSGYQFAEKKQATHSDEIWSYGQANSFYQCSIYIPQGVFVKDTDGILENYINFREWVSGQELHDYVTVQKGEQFRYDSVYSNSVDGVHPPLYFFLLHTVCSFFPDSYSLWYGFALNLIFMVVLQLYLFKLARLFCKSPVPALICCALYGAGTGALNTMLFIRMYCLLSMLTVMYVYYSAAFCEAVLCDEEKALKKYLPSVGITAFCLFFTSYLTIAFCGVFTALLCVYLLCKKKLGRAIAYGLTVAAALGLMLAVFPVAFKHIFGSGELNRSPFTFDNQFRRISSYVLSETVGIYISIFQSSTDDIILAVIGALIVLMLPLCFLFRKEEWFRKLTGRVKAALKSVPGKLKEASFLPLITFASGLTVILVLARLIDIYHNGSFVRRYIFNLYPIAVLLAVWLVWRALRAFPKIRKAVPFLMTAGAAALAVLINLNYPTIFIMEHYGDYTDITKLTQDKNVLVVVQRVSDEDEGNVAKSWIVTCYAAYLRDCESAFILTDNDYDRYLSDIDDGREISYALVNEGTFEMDEETERRILRGKTDRSAKTVTADSTMQSVVDETDNKLTQLNERLEQLNGGSTAEPLFAMNIQGETMIVVKIDKINK